VETELYYNRFRYYHPETGLYISQDPIGLAGNNPNFYAYTFDSNTQVDPFGLVLGKSRPSGGWNYDNKPKIDNFELHHVIPKSLARHEVLQKIGFDVNKLDNLIYLSKDIGGYGNRSAHKGYSGNHSKYNQNMRSELDKIAKMGGVNNWTKQQYADAVNKVRKDTRQGLRKGTIKCK
jgi:uncharacterized protein RhaS with RHS repeats